MIKVWAYDNKRRDFETFREAKNYIAYIPSEEREGDITINDINTHKPGIVAATYYIRYHYLKNYLRTDSIFVRDIRLEPVMADLKMIALYLHLAPSYGNKMNCLLPEEIKTHYQGYKARDKFYIVTTAPINEGQKPITAEADEEEVD